MNMVKIQNEQFLIYSTREGLLQFAKTGLTDEIPEIFYHPLTVEQRIEILNGVRQCCETGVYRFLQKPLSHLPHNLHFCIRGTMGSMVFRNNTGQIIVLNIEETCLVSIFRDYLEHMNPASYYSTEKQWNWLTRSFTTCRTTEINFCIYHINENTHMTVDSLNLQSYGCFFILIRAGSFNH